MAQQVALAAEAGEFPLVIGGNCGCVVGTAAGLGIADRGGVVWFDAHADAHTPDSTGSGFIDGMGSAVLLGRCWGELARSIPGFRALSGDRLLLAGVRAMDDRERSLISSAGASLVGPVDLGGEGSAFAEAVNGLAERVDFVHVHIDLDVIDPVDGVANEYAVPDGPHFRELLAALEMIGRRAPVGSASLTSYNPTGDADHRARTSALTLLDSLALLTT